MTTRDAPDDTRTLGIGHAAPKQGLGNAHQVLADPSPRRGVRTAEPARTALVEALEHGVVGPTMPALPRFVIRPGSARVDRRRARSRRRFDESAPGAVCP